MITEVRLSGFLQKSSLVQSIMQDSNRGFFYDDETGIVYCATRNKRISVCYDSGMRKEFDYNQPEDVINVLTKEYVHHILLMFAGRSYEIKPSEPLTVIRDIVNEFDEM